MEQTERIEAIVTENEFVENRVQEKEITERQGH